MIGREKEFVEIDRFTLDNGQEVILSEKTKYGDHDKSDFNSDSMKQIYVCRKIKIIAEK